MQKEENATLDWFTKEHFIKGFTLTKGFWFRFRTEPEEKSSKKRV